MNDDLVKPTIRENIEEVRQGAFRAAECAIDDARNNTGAYYSGSHALLYFKIRVILADYLYPKGGLSHD
jgi:hypothetical protein